MITTGASGAIAWPGRSHTRASRRHGPSGPASRTTIVLVEYSSMSSASARWLRSASPAVPVGAVEAAQQHPQGLVEGVEPVAVQRGQDARLVGGVLGDGRVDDREPAFGQRDPETPAVVGIEPPLDQAGRLQP